MARKADPILVRSGINRSWKENVAKKISPSNLHYVLERVNKSLASINANLIELSIFRIRSIEKYIVQILVLKYFPQKFKKRLALAKYFFWIRNFYKSFWQTSDYGRKVIGKLGTLNLKYFISYYKFWFEFLRFFEQKKLLQQNIYLRYFFQKYFISNVKVFLMDPLESINEKFLFKDHPTSYLFALPDKSKKRLKLRLKQTDKWAKNLKRLMTFCFKYQQLNFLPVLVRFIATELEKDKRHWPIINAVKRSFKHLDQNSKLKGIKVRFVGKLKGSRRSRVHDLTWNAKIPFQTFNNNILVSSSTAYTIYGTIGIKFMVWRDRNRDSVEINYRNT